MRTHFPRVTIASTLFFGMLTAAVPAFADGTANILPSSATPLGYSLSDLATATAVYNTGTSSGNPATPPPPSIPFTVLESDAAITPGTYLYLPIFFADDSAPADPAFPADVSNHAAVAAYLDNLVLTGFNVSAFFAQIDGQKLTLDDSYIVGVTTPSLLDGTPAGTHYITIAVAVSPLSPGSHSVGFGGIIAGQPVVFGSDSITVTPEPATAALLGLGATLLLRRRANNTRANH